jgi:hypothetical protein
LHSPLSEKAHSLAASFEDALRFFELNQDDPVSPRAAVAALDQSNV